MSAISAEVPEWGAPPAPSPTLSVVDVHVHDWRLQAVVYDDGFSAEEFGCAGCGSVTFR